MSVMFSTEQDCSLPLALCCSPAMLHKLDEITVKNSAEIEGFQACKEGYLETT